MTRFPAGGQAYILGQKRIPPRPPVETTFTLAIDRPSRREPDAPQKGRRATRPARAPPGTATPKSRTRVARAGALRPARPPCAGAGGGAREATLAHVDARFFDPRLYQPTLLVANATNQAIDRASPWAYTSTWLCFAMSCHEAPVECAARVHAGQCSHASSFPPRCATRPAAGQSPS